MKKCRVLYLSCKNDGASRAKIDLTESNSFKKCPCNSRAHEIIYANPLVRYVLSSFEISNGGP